MPRVPKSLTGLPTQKCRQINSGIPPLNFLHLLSPSKDRIMPNTEADELTNARKQGLLLPPLLLCPPHRRQFGWACFLQNTSPGQNVYYFGIAHCKDIVVTQKTQLWPQMALGGTSASFFTKLPDCPELQLYSLSNGHRNKETTPVKGP